MKGLIITSLSHKLIFADGRELVIDSIMEWCRNNPYSDSFVYRVKNKGIPHKDIVTCKLTFLKSFYIIALNI